MRLSIAPTVDTASNVGVEARVSAELDFFAIHAGAGGGGGWVAGQPASAWQVGVGGSIPVGRSDNDRNWIDFDLLYSGYFLHAVQEVNPDASPYANGVRLGTSYRRVIKDLGHDDRLFFGIGLFGEASFRDGMALGIFGLPLSLHLLLVPHVKIF